MAELIPTAMALPRAHVGLLRVGDTERNLACDQLSAQYAAGRLQPFELEERLSLAVNARTRLDLDQLLSDLPPLTAPSPPKVVAVPPPPAATWTGLDVLAALGLLGAVPMALVGMFLVVGVGQGAVAIAVLVTLVAMTIGAASVHLAHRAAARSELRIRAELRASGDDSRR